MAGRWWPVLQAALSQAPAVEGTFLRDAVFAQAPYSPHPEEDMEAGRTLAAEVARLPQGTRVALHWAVRRVQQASGYIPGGTQEALLAMYGGNGLAVTLNQLADTLRRL